MRWLRAAGRHIQWEQVLRLMDQADTNSAVMSRKGSVKRHKCWSLSGKICPTSYKTLWKKKWKIYKQVCCLSLGRRIDMEACYKKILQSKRGKTKEDNQEETISHNYWQQRTPEDRFQCIYGLNSLVVLKLDLLMLVAKHSTFVRVHGSSTSVKCQGNHRQHTASSQLDSRHALTSDNETTKPLSTDQPITPLEVPAALNKWPGFH